MDPSSVPSVPSQASSILDLSEATAATSEAIAERYEVDDLSSSRLKKSNQSPFNHLNLQPLQDQHKLQFLLYHLKLHYLRQHVIILLQL